MELDIVLKLMECFPGSKINQFGEFIAHEKGNAYFILKKCKSELDIKCKVLEWLSREAYKAEPFRRKDKNEAYHRFILGGINKYLNSIDEFKSKYDLKATKIIQYDMNMNFIKEWPSITDAEETLGIKSISKVINLKRRSAGGYVWRRKKD